MVATPLLAITAADARGAASRRGIKVAAPDAARRRLATACEVGAVGHGRQQGHEPQLSETAGVAGAETRKEARCALLEVDELVDTRRRRGPFQVRGRLGAGPFAARARGDAAARVTSPDLSAPASVEAPHPLGTRATLAVLHGLATVAPRQVGTPPAARPLRDGPSAPLGTLPSRPCASSYALSGEEAPPEPDLRRDVEQMAPRAGLITDHGPLIQHHPPSGPHEAFLDGPISCSRSNSRYCYRRYCCK